MNRRKFIGVSAAGAVGLAAADLIFEKELLQTTHHSVKLRESQSRRAIRMVQISDLHLRGFGRHEQKVVKATADAKPDVIAITGDSIDHRRYVGALDEFLAALPSGITKLAITGNWEYWAGLDIAALGRQYARHDCRLLMDESLALPLAGSSLRVIGIQDLVGGLPDVARALSNLPDADAEIILAHCPAHRDVVTTRRSVMISGHTHGGQIALPGYVPFVPLGSGGYKRGWYSTANGPLFVSRGIGTSNLHARCNSVPEVAVFDLAV